MGDTGASDTVQIPSISRLNAVPRLRRQPDAQAPQAAAPYKSSEVARGLLETAERLFAQEGVDAVPLSRIVTEAGHRNASGLHYHFGSRGAVVAQLLNMRLEALNALRSAQLDRIERSGRADDARAVYEAVVEPLLQTIRTTDWGPHYVQVLAQVVESPRMLQRESLDRTHFAGLLRVRTLLHAALPQVPPEVLDERMVWANDNVVLALARWSRIGALAGPRRAAVPELLDYCVAGLGAPVSAARPARGARASLKGSIGYFYG